mgnify:CR=1 FL=1
MFSGLRVLELQQHLAGALCGRLFAGWGADVRTILPADPAFQPLSPEASLWANAGKQATTDALADACATADLIIDAWAPGALEAAGIDPTALVGNGRRPVLCRITPFGQIGHQDRAEQVRWGNSDHFFENRPADFQIPPGGGQIRPGARQTRFRLR